MRTTGARQELPTEGMYTYSVSHLRLDIIPVIRRVYMHIWSAVPRIHMFTKGGRGVLRCAVVGSVTNNTTQNFINKNAGVWMRIMRGYGYVMGALNELSRFVFEGYKKGMCVFGVIQRVGEVHSVVGYEGVTKEGVFAECGVSA